MYRRDQNQTFYKHLLAILCACTGTTQRSLERSDPVCCPIAIKPLAREPGDPHPKSNVTMEGSRSAASHPANRGIADIDDMATVLTLSAVCLWDPDFRTILTFVARMSQMAWDAGARVLVVNTRRVTHGLATHDALSRLPQPFRPCHDSATYGALSQLRSLVGIAGLCIAGCAIWGRRWGRSAAHCTTSAVAPDGVKMLHSLFECLTDTRCYTA